MFLHIYVCKYIYLFVYVCVGTGYFGVKDALYTSEGQYKYCQWPHFAFCFTYHDKEQVLNEVSPTGSAASTADCKYAIKIGSVVLLHLQ